MSAINAIDIRSKANADSLRIWPAEVEQLAWEAWAFLDDQNCTAVARRLADGEMAMDENGDPAAYEVPIRTIQHWARENNWAARREDFFAASASGIMRDIFSNLMLAAKSGSAYLRKVAVHAGQPTPIRDQRGRAQTLDGEWIEVRAAFTPDKNAIQAAIAAIDRVGLSPTGRNDPNKVVISNTASVKHVSDMASLSDNELDELERTTSIGH